MNYNKIDFSEENTDHLIEAIQGEKRYPTVIAFGGIHGNEQSGVRALESIMQQIKDFQIPFKGSFYTIKGNLKAIKDNKRFVDVDLNRIWNRSRINKLNELTSEISEIEEQKKLYKLIKQILNTNRGPFYFLDLHTTSSHTVPFITISDSLNNRRFTSKFKLPVILGIEEYLEGPLLTYLNEFGHISLGFEAGQHEKDSSIIHCESFLWLALVYSGCIRKQNIQKYREYKSILGLYKSSTFYHIKHKYRIEEGEKFTMNKGYTNFQEIQKGETMAESDGKLIKAPQSGQIFMPLYQNQGEDGFFIVTKISSFWLILSRILRKLNLHEGLRLLPGVKKVSDYTLRVNPKTARFLTTQIFHLFGYRKRVKKEQRWYFTKRDRKISPLN